MVRSDDSFAFRDMTRGDVKGDPSVENVGQASRLPENAVEKGASQRHTLRFSTGCYRRLPVIVSVSFQCGCRMAKTLRCTRPNASLSCGKIGRTQLFPSQCHITDTFIQYPLVGSHAHPCSLGREFSSGGDNSAKFSGPSLRREFTRRLVLISLNAHASGRK